MKTSTTYRPSAFTLIELLVVISIIALLISILLPALGKARASGTQVSCLSRIRAMNFAQITYQADYKMYYPYGQDVRLGTSFLQIRTYINYLAPYIGFDCIGNTRVDYNREFLHCPALWPEVANATDQDLTRCGTYAYNSNMMGWLNAAGYDGSGKYSLFNSGKNNVNDTDIQTRLGTFGGTESKCVTFTDGWSPLGDTAEINCEIRGHFNMAAFYSPHFETVNYRATVAPYSPLTGLLTATNGRMNVTFLDGHARSANPAEFPTYAGGSGLASWQINP